MRGRLPVSPSPASALRLPVQVGEETLQRIVLTEKSRGGAADRKGTNAPGLGLAQLGPPARTGHDVARLLAAAQPQQVILHQPEGHAVIVVGVPRTARDGAEAAHAPPPTGGKMQMSGSSGMGISRPSR